MRARIGLVLGLALLVAAVAGWWLASPWWTLTAMRDAARAHDQAKLSAYVDYPALRTDLKEEMMRQMISPGETEGGDSVVKLVAATIAGPLIDAAVTPQGVQAMFDSERVAERPGATPETSAGRLPHLPAAKDSPVIERDGLSQFRVHAREPGSATMVFRRSGLGWKLAGVDLPPPPHASAME